ncbi:MAG: isoamylase early set domain-containing protein [Gemmatimonadetes bacterium]|nr:isoamylase early set domain-containing protein [Gemmatimonadota bacterium]
MVQELQHPVRLDESFDRRVMVRVRRSYAERRHRGIIGWLGAAASISRRPAWAAALAAGVVAVVSIGLIPHGGTKRLNTAGQAIPVQFVLVAPGAHSVAVVGDFNNWGLGDTALVAENHNGVWSVSAPVHTGVHRYAFLVNGKQWVADPTAPRAAGDDFGQPSSALVVEASTQ